jgi:hypothetical protein
LLIKTTINTKAEELLGVYYDINNMVVNYELASSRVWRCSADSVQFDGERYVCRFCDITNFDRDRAKKGDIIVDTAGGTLSVSSVSTENEELHCEKIGWGASEIKAYIDEAISTVYIGTSEPTSDVGDDGDLYVLRS